MHCFHSREAPFLREHRVCFQFPPAAEVPQEKTNQPPNNVEKNDVPDPKKMPDLVRRKVEQVEKQLFGPRQQVEKTGNDAQKIRGGLRAPRAKPEVDGPATVGNAAGDIAQDAAKAGTEAPKREGEPVIATPDAAAPETGGDGKQSEKRGNAPPTKEESLAAFRAALLNGKESLDDKEKAVLQKATDSILAEAEKLNFDAANPKNFMDQVGNLMQKELDTNAEYKALMTKMDADAEKEQPLTEADKKNIEHLLKNSMLSMAQEATEDPATKTQLSLLWLRGNGYDLMKGVEQTDANIKNPENYVGTEGMGKFISLIVFYITAMRLLKQKMTSTLNPKEQKNTNASAGAPPETPEMKEQKIKAFNESQKEFQITLEKGELHIEPATPKETEYLSRMLEEHTELGFDGRVATGKNGAAFILSPDQFDKLALLLSGEGKKKEEAVQSLDLKVGKDGGYQREGWGGKYTILSNGNVYWSGGKSASGTEYGPQTYENGVWKQQPVVRLTSLDDGPQFMKYLDTQFARAKNVPQEERGAIVKSLEEVASVTDGRAKNSREELQLAPSKDDAQNKLTLKKAQTSEMQSEMIRTIIGKIREIKT